MALTVEQFRQRVETTLGDEALGALLSAAYEAIANSDIGPPGDVSEFITVDGGDLLVLSRPADTIVSVVERGVTLSSDDYALRTPTILLRLRTGTHPSSYWRGRVEPTYTVEDGLERDRIAAELVALELAYQPGVVSRRIGEWSETYAQGDRSYAQEREAIFGSYFAAGGAFV